MSIAARIKKYFRVVDLEVYENLELNFKKVELSSRRMHFLVNNAPLLNLSTESNPRDTMAKLGRVGTKFAYLHPTTFAQATGIVRNDPMVSEGRIAPGKTRWIYTLTLPIGAVIFSNNAMPGLEKSNA